MSVFLQSTTEENLYLCILNGVWGSKTNKLTAWYESDRMIAYVERKLAALFTVVGEPFVDHTPIWSGDEYPYRISVRLEKIVAPTERYSISSHDLREVLFKHHGSSYAVALVLSARPLAEAPAHKLLERLEQSPAWTEFELDSALDSIQHEEVLQQSIALDDAVEARSEPSEFAQSWTTHTEMQFYLARLGQSMNFQIWIPKSDHGRAFRKTTLQSLSEPDLPSLPFSDDVVRIIKNIDVIWLNEGHPTHLFEVEHTTSIYSGLLRMSDLITMIPSLNINMFICSEADRKAKVIAEVNRPTFERRKVPLAKICRFISFERLAEFMASYQSVLGFFSVSILEEISESLAK